MALIVSGIAGGTQSRVIHSTEPHLRGSLILGSRTMKTRYVITYDLRQPGSDYDGLLKWIKARPWAQLSKSSYAVYSDLTASEIRDALKPFLDTNDVLVVVPTVSGAAWLGLSTDVSDWMKKHS